MYAGQDLYQYLQQLYAYIETQSQKVKQMETTLKDLYQEIETIKNISPVTIEKIEYKFDQLKVEKLEGTLNIGLSPQGVKSIEEFAVNDQNLGQLNTEASQEVQINQQYSDLQRKIKSEIDQYMEREIPNQFQQLATKYHVPIDKAEYQHFIVEDIKKQVNDRIKQYISSMSPYFDSQGLSMEQVIIDHVKKDIGVAIENFLRKVPRREEEMG